MTWLRHYRHDVPEVPDDTEARLSLIAGSEARLAEVQGSSGSIMDLTSSLRARNDQNHFAMSLQLALGGPRGM